MNRWVLSSAVRLLILTTLTVSALAQAVNSGVNGSAATWAPMPPPLPVAQNVAYPGTIQLFVDATDLSHRLFRIRENIPVLRAGDMILLIPKWLPGDHEPDGEVQKMAGFTFSSGTQPLTWKRDTVEVNAFHVNVPAGVREVTAEFQYL